MRARMLKLALPFFVLLATVFASPAWSHETPIAKLEIHELQSQPGSYKVDWNFSSSTKLKPPTAVYPEHCALNGIRLDCGEQGLYGLLRFERLGISYSAVVVRLHRSGQDMQSFTLTGSDPSITLTPGGRMPLSQVLSSYLPLGVEHILLGVDHLLFVFGLMLLVQKINPLIKTITAFTVAHSFSLAAATFGWIGVPESSVNAAIALSIVIVAVEVLKLREGKTSWTVQYPWVVAFGFGLLHGLGFASALTGIGLPPENVPAALLFFNVGVELGQIGFVLLVLALLWAQRRLHVAQPRWAETVGVYAMGTISAFWFIDRLFAIVDPKVMI